MPIIALEDLDTAEFFWETFEPQAGGASWKDLERLKSPQNLLEGLRGMDPRCARWSGFAVTYRRRLGKILQSAQEAQRLAASLERLADDPSTDLDWLGTLLASLDPEALAALAKESPLAAFRIAHLHWVVAGQRGDVDTAFSWARLCNAYWTEQLSAYPDGIYRIADLLNRRFITEFHSLYRFQPEVPQWLSNLRDRLESLRQRHVISGTTPAMPSLGKLYGTIAQNYGFCGPQYLDQTCLTVERAWDAFGGERVRELEKERRRQDHYLVCAYLDAGRWEEARTALERYLAGPLEKLNPSCLNAYQHAAFARFLAETSFRPATYASWCRDQLRRCAPRHPWQLWLWNAGRLLSDKEEKRQAWLKGVELCFRLGVTAHPMALLHAAWLHAEKLAAREDLERIVAKVFREIRESRLNEHHFAPLLSKRTWREVLETVLATPGTFFPFTYR